AKIGKQVRTERVGTVENLGEGGLVVIEAVAVIGRRSRKTRRVVVLSSRPECKHSVDTGVRAEGVVGSDDWLVVAILSGNRGHIIVCVSWPIGQRQQLEEPHANGTDSIGRNHIVGEGSARVSFARILSRYSTGGRQRIVNR